MDLHNAIQTTSATSNGVPPLGTSISDPPTQSEVQAIVSKLDELINTLRRNPWGGRRPSSLVAKTWVGNAGPPLAGPVPPAGKRNPATKNEERGTAWHRTLLDAVPYPLERPREKKA